jgi:hypothetical protein
VTNESRRGTAEKILPILDVIYAILGAVLAIFGRRKSDGPLEGPPRE